MAKFFRTITPEVDFPFEIDYHSKMMFIGSCFTENIGGRLKKAKFDTLVNPFGIMFNPISVKRAIQLIAGESEFAKSDLIYHNELWHSLHHHSDFSRTHAEDVLDTINNQIRHSADFLRTANFLFITFGTAWIYEYKKTGEVVANCHKLPQEEFNKRLLDADEVLIEYFQLLKILKNINPKLNVIFTISPVRHLNNGQTGNFFSKSVLAVAIQQLLKIYDSESLYYFPAYELQHDDLRDYRFYDSDMVHPSKDAVDYIYDYFQNSFFGRETKELAGEVEKIVKAYYHRPFNIDTDSYKQFKAKTVERIIDLNRRFPKLNFEQELKYFKS